MHGSIQIFSDTGRLFDALLSHWQTVAAEAIVKRGAFHVALAGGGTPRDFYIRLTQTNNKDLVEWDKVHLYFGDERCVPQDHADSNYRMAREALFSRVAIPSSQIHAMFNPSQDAQTNAEEYANLLEQQLPKDDGGFPVFDLILLGMGPDGHTASLFPDTEILRQTTKPVAAQFVGKLDAWRISLTFPTINAARHVALLVVGESKADIISEISNNRCPEEHYPIQRVNPKGNLQWFLDHAAAPHLMGSENS